MSAEAQGLQIPISMSLEEAQAALRSLEQAAREAGKRIKHGVEEGAKGGGTALEQFARTQRREAGVARYYVSQLAEIVPVSGAAKGALMELTGMFVGGLGVGAAIGAATIALRFLSSGFLEAGEAMRKADEELKRARDSLSATRDRAGELAAELRGGALAAAQFRYSQAAVRESEEVLRIEGEIAKKRRDLADDSKNTLEGLGREVRVKKEIAALEAQAAEAKERLSIAWMEFEKAQRTADEAAIERSQRVVSARTAAATEAERKADEARRKAEAQAKADLAWEIQHQNALFEIRYNAEQRRIEMQRQAAMMTGTFVEAGGDLGKAGQLQALYEDSAKRLAAIQEMETAGVLATQDAEMLRTAVVEEQGRRRLEILRTESQAMQQVQQMGISALRSFSTAATSEFGKALRSSRAYERAMQAATGATVEGADLSAAAFAAMAQDTLASVAQQAAVESIFQLARGFAFASTGNAASATAAFTAAGYFAATAAAAGAAALVIGQTRGMTRSERASVDAARPDALGPSPSASSRLAEQGGGVRSATEAAPQIEKHFIYVGDPFLTPAENARMIARRIDLMERLDLRRVS